MLVRVVDKPYVRWPARVLGPFAAFGLLGIVFDDAYHAGLVPLTAEHGGYALVSALFVLAAAAPWLVRPARSRVARLQVLEGLVRVGPHVIRAAETTSLRVVPAHRGFSVAVARGQRVLFLEVERARDAADIARAIGERDAALDLAAASRAMRNVRVALSVLTLFAALFYIATVIGWATEGGKTLAGLLGVAVAHGAALVGALATRHDFVGTPWAQHVALHTLRSGVTAQPSEDEEWTARRDEPIGAWLARLDGVPSGSSAYRDSASREALWGILANDHAAVDARVGAARVLYKRHGEERAELVRVADDVDVRLRVEAAMDDDACEKIERLGPVFRYPARP